MPPVPKRTQGKVFDLRGTHGSGKSTTVRLLLERYNWGVKHTIDEEQLGYHIPEIDCGVIARYTEFGGGCDSVQPATEVVRRVKLFSSLYKFTVFEGVLISHTYQRYADLADELGRQNYKFLFMDTPLETCIARVEGRRQAKGNMKPLDPRNVIKDHRTDWEKLRPKFTANGYNVGIIDHTRALECLLEELT